MKLQTCDVTIFVSRTVKKSVVKAITDVTERLPAELVSGGVSLAHEVDPFSVAVIVEADDEVVGTSAGSPGIER